MTKANYYSGEEGLWVPDDATINTFNTATAQLTFQGIVPLAYRHLQLGWGSWAPDDTRTSVANDWWCNIPGVGVVYRHARVAPVGQYRSLEGVDGHQHGGLLFNSHVIGLPPISDLDLWQQVPDPNLLETMFSSQKISSGTFWMNDGRGADLNPYWFYSRNLPFVPLRTNFGHGYTQCAPP